MSGHPSVEEVALATVSRPRDAIASVLLTVLAIGGWWATFDGIAWLLVGAAGASLGSVIAVLHARRRLLGWALVTVPIAYVGLAICVLGVSFGANGWPRSQTWSRVLTGTWECWPLLVGTHPPVEASGTVLLAPALAGVVTAALATGLAFSRRPGAPVVPLLVLLTGVLVTGSHGSSVALLGAAYGLACLVWVVVRSGGAGGAPVVARWPVAAPVLVVCTVLAVPLGGSLLGEQRDRLVLREETAAYGVSVVLTPLDTFRRYRKQPALPDNAWRRPLLGVTRPGDASPAGTMLRFAVLNRYDGTRWVTANDVEPGSHEDRFQLLSADYLTTDEAIGQTPLRIEVTGHWNSQWVPLTGRLLGINTDFPGAVPVSQLRFNPVTSSAIATRTLGASDEYEFFSDTPDTLLPRDASPSPSVDRATYDAAEFADTWARAALARASSPLDAVRRASAMMKKRGRYSDGAFGWEVRFAQGQDRLRLDDFLNGAYTVGNDEQYAAAMALVATRIGVPARVVVGARVPVDGVVKGRDVVAWVELRVVTPDGTESWRELPRASYMSFRRPRQNDPPQDPVVVPPEAPASEVDPPAQPPQTDRDDPQDEPSRSDEHVAGRSWKWLWLLALLAPGAVPLVKVVRRHRRRHAPRVTARYVGAWQELVDRARDLGVAVPARRSRPLQAVALGAVDLARSADDAVFGSGVPSVEDAESYWRTVLDRRTSLHSGLPSWRRWLAPFSLASLRRT